MEFTKISRSLSYEMVNGFGLKLWDKLGAEMEVTKGADPKDGYAAMKELIEEVHKESFPGFESVVVSDSHAVPDKQVDKPTAKDSMITAITTCTEVATLKTFEKLAKSKPEFQKAYDETMDLLTNKK